jgi:phage tail-like protein
MKAVDTVSETRYFIFNHEAAFVDCRCDGAVWAGGAMRLAEGAVRGFVKTPMLDSGERGNAWQRVLAELSVPCGAGIVWRVYASDKEITDAEPVFTAQNADDFLLIDVRGRYLTLTAELFGDAEIRSVQIYSAWESFLDYLPEIYRDYNGFTDRFLRLFAAQYLDLERQIDELSGTFDPIVAPEETLRWLAELVGVPHVGLWRTEGLRKLLSSGLYGRRGQFSALADYIEYFTGHRPYIAEHYRYMTGEDVNDRLYGDGDVTVFMPPEAAALALNIDAINLVIADFLPEDISCRVLLLDNYPVVSGYAYLGINTRVGAYEETVVGMNRIGFSVVGGSV